MISGYKMAEKQPPDSGQIALLHGLDIEPLVGTVHYVTAPTGVDFPVFHIQAAGRKLPIVYLDQGSAEVEVERWTVTFEEYFQLAHRRRLAGFHKAFCQNFGCKLDDYATLNVVVHLERQGFFDVPEQAELQRAVDLTVKVRKGFYDYVGRLQQRLVEHPDPDNWH